MRKFSVISSSADNPTAVSLQYALTWLASSGDVSALAEETQGLFLPFLGPVVLLSTVLKAGSLVATLPGTWCYRLCIVSVAQGQLQEHQPTHKLCTVSVAQGQLQEHQPTHTLCTVSVAQGWLQEHQTTHKQTLHCQCSPGLAAGTPTNTQTNSALSV